MRRQYFIVVVVLIKVVVQRVFILSENIGLCQKLNVVKPSRVQNFTSTSKRIFLTLLMGQKRREYGMNTFMRVILHPPLKQDTDFFVDTMLAENSLPIQFHQSSSLINDHLLISLILNTENIESWKKNSMNLTEIGIIGVYSCPKKYHRVGDLIISGNESVNSASMVIIARLVEEYKSVCPLIPDFIDHENGLITYIQNQQNLQGCYNIKLVHVNELSTFMVDNPIDVGISLKDSFLIILMEFEMLLIDAINTSLKTSTKIVDTFLSKYSIFYLSWEPYTKLEPRWFVLFKYPRGVPGHLAAMVDSVQFHHPLVKLNSVELLDIQHRQCINKNMTSNTHTKVYTNGIRIPYKATLSTLITESNFNNCVMGCPGTWLSRVSTSGWGADTQHLGWDVKRAVLFNEPYQAAPMTFRIKYDPNGTNVFDEGAVGWTYTYGGCPSHFLGCYFLPHSPCPPVHVDPYPILGSNRSRVRIWNTDTRLIDQKKSQLSSIWWINVMVFGPGRLQDGNPIYPLSSSGRKIEDDPSIYFLKNYMLRPKYLLRRLIHRKRQQFNLKGNCAAIHVRRGDASDDRAYITLESYVRLGRPLMDVMGIRTILLLTDSQDVIKEAVECKTSYPDVCRGITFRYINKKRFQGSEGGFENHYPTGDMKSEFLAIQLEFALVKQCDMYVIGDSNFGELIRSHIAAGYPYQARGSLPHRFLNPPGIRIAQGIDIYMKGYKKTHEQLMNTPVKAIQAFLLDSDKKEIMIDAQTNDTRMKEFVQSSIRMYCQYAKILAIKKDFCVT